MGGSVTEFSPWSGVHRRSVVTALAALAVAQTVKAEPCAPPRVLFVCPAGSVNSAIARETLKRQAALAHVSIRAESRGLNPANHVSPALAAHLSADGIDPAAEPLRALADGDLKGVDVV